MLLKLEGNLEFYLNNCLLKVIELVFEKLRIINYDFVLKFFVKFNWFVDKLDIIFYKLMLIWVDYVVVVSRSSWLVILIMCLIEWNVWFVLGYIDSV